MSKINLRRGAEENAPHRGSHKLRVLNHLGRRVGLLSSRRAGKTRVLDASKRNGREVNIPASTLVVQCPIAGKPAMVLRSSREKTQPDLKPCTSLRGGCSQAPGAQFFRVGLGTCFNHLSLSTRSRIAPSGPGGVLGPSDWWKQRGGVQLHPGTVAFANCATVV